MYNNINNEACINQVVTNLKSQGNFDQFRRECLADVDTKPSYRNLLQRVEGYVSNFLCKQNWYQSINKNHLRNKLRNEINDSDMLKNGIEHLVDQVVNEKVRNEFKGKIEDALKDCLGIKNEKEVLIKRETENDLQIKNETCIEPDGIELNEQTNDITDNPAILEKAKTEQISDEEDFDSTSIENIISENQDSNITEQNNSKIIEHEICTKIDPVDKVMPIDEEKVEQVEVEAFEPSETNIQCDIEPEPTATEITETVQPEVKQEFESSESLKAESIDSDLSSANITCNEEIKVDVSNVNEEDKDNMSEISSVHTSDLSDFDDEISLDDSDEEVAKKKISLKVAKELTASISGVRSGNEKIKCEQSYKTESSDAGEGPESLTKRKRKVNPKFISADFSYNLKNKKIKIDNVESTDKEKKKKSQDGLTTRPNLKRKQTSDVNEKVELKPTKVSRARKGSDTGLTSEKPAMKTRGRKPNGKSNKRYDSSDLYKPRHSLSSRRGRLTTAGPPTPDSNSNSTAEEAQLN